MNNTGGTKNGVRFAAKYGPWALVTGAAQGLGAAFAEAIASRGLNVILVDMQRERVSEQALAVQRNFGVATVAVVADLSRRDFMVALRRARLEIGLLVCNAGMAVRACFWSRTAAMLMEIDVNCAAPLLLTHGFGHGWRARAWRHHSSRRPRPCRVRRCLLPTQRARPTTGAGRGALVRDAQQGVDVMSHSADNTPGRARAIRSCARALARKNQVAAPTAEAALRARAAGAGFRGQPQDQPPQSRGKMGEQFLPDHAKVLRNAC
jgi:NAD(P)-dependent dehydrogenase (short-subunit alcohol dehydrogenase family)